MAQGGSATRYKTLMGTKDPNAFAFSEQELYYEDDAEDQGGSDQSGGKVEIKA